MSIIVAASASYADVNTALAAAGNGDTIQVPAGTATWSSTLDVTKMVTFEGAGVGQTVITANRGDNFIIHYIPASPSLDLLFRITGFEFNMNSIHAILHMEVANPVPAMFNIRIDHNKVVNTTYGHAIIWHEGPFWGVVDHNEFNGEPYFQNYGCFDGANNWEQLTFDPGSRKAMYYEDNIISISTDGTLFSTGNGGRFVFRYNTATITNGSLSGLFPYLDAHGNMGAGGNYGTMGKELYGNLLIDTGFEFDATYFDDRGGKSRVFNNRMTGTGSEGTIQIREENSDTLNPPANNEIDGTPQHINDAYYWQNRDRSDTMMVKSFSENTGSTPITEDVDFFYHIAAFNGTAGMGVGTAADRDAITPTVTGVGFWTTNDSATTVPTTMAGLKTLTGSLYRWNGSAWVLYYTPYQYPHPLTVGEAGTPALRTIVAMRSVQMI